MISQAEMFHQQQQMMHQAMTAQMDEENVFLLLLASEGSSTALAGKQRIEMDNRPTSPFEADTAEAPE